jgi:hypothetical protein
MASRRRSEKDMYRPRTIARKVHAAADAYAANQAYYASGVASRRSETLSLYGQRVYPVRPRFQFTLLGISYFGTDQHSYSFRRREIDNQT